MVKIFPEKCNNFLGRLSQVNTESRVLHVKRLKHGLSTTHPLRGDELRAIKAWLTERARMKPDSGDILIGTEDYEWIKHITLAAGWKVWSAGEIGIENHQIRLVNVQSGHFVVPNVPPGTGLAQHLISFTNDVFQQYAQTFSLTCLHPQFACVWQSQP